MTRPDLRFTLIKSSAVPRSAFAASDLEALSRYVLGRERVRENVDLNVDLTSPGRIQKLNRRFRGVDRATDVISFRDDLEKGFCGDIAINVRQAAVQAQEMGHPVRREIRLLLIHGILHLLGYTDYEPRPRRRMFKRQNALLRRWEGRRT